MSLLQSLNTPMENKNRIQTCAFDSKSEIVKISTTEDYHIHFCKDEPSVRLNMPPYTNPLEVSSFEKVLSHYLKGCRKTVVIYDLALKKTHLPRLLKAVSSNTLATPFLLGIKVNEKKKDLKLVQKVIHYLLKAEVQRNTYVISFGGGICGDIVGLACALTKRGLRLMSIPTTLLSMVDSSIGGKNGVNHSTGKNQIGTFYNPHAVIINPSFLTTLRIRDLRNGFAEIVKASLIEKSALQKEPELFSYLISCETLLNEHFTNPSKGRALNKQSKTKEEFTNFLEFIIRKSTVIKMALVEDDYKDHLGLRNLLNLGHSFAHAIETLYKRSEKYLHGEAVAIGIALAGNYSLESGGLTAEEQRLIVKLLLNAGLPTHLKPLSCKSIQKLLYFMLQDKKNSDVGVNLVLLKGIGEAYLQKNIPTEKLLKFLTKHLKKKLINS